MRHYLKLISLVISWVEYFRVLLFYFILTSISGIYSCRVSLTHLLKSLVNHWYIFSIFIPIHKFLNRNIWVFSGWEPMWSEERIFTQHMAQYPDVATRMHINVHLKFLLHKEFMVEFIPHLHILEFIFTQLWMRTNFNYVFLKGMYYFFFLKCHLHTQTL